MAERREWMLKRSNRSSRRVDFLRYTLVPHRNRKDGHRYLRPSPSRKRVGRLKQKLRELPRPSNGGTWEEVSGRLNQMLRGWMLWGWTNSFSYGTRMPPCRAVDNIVYQRARGFLRRRHKVQSRGRRRLSDAVVCGKVGVPRLHWVQLGPPAPANPPN